MLFIAFFFQGRPLLKSKCKTHDGAVESKRSGRGYIQTSDDVMKEFDWEPFEQAKFRFCTMKPSGGKQDLEACYVRIGRIWVFPTQNCNLHCGLIMKWQLFSCLVTTRLTADGA